MTGSRPIPDGPAPNGMPTNGQTAPARGVSQLASARRRTAAPTFDHSVDHYLVSFPEFYNQHYTEVARALSVHFGNSDLGQEATDEAMTRAYDHWGTVSGHSNPAGWVYRVGLNWGRSWYRRASRTLPWTTRDQAELPPTSDPALQQALADLDEKYRAVVVCRYLLDWSTEQTADALDIAPGTVKSRLHAALNKLRSNLGTDGEPSIGLGSITALPVRPSNEVPQPNDTYYPTPHPDQGAQS